jgi:CubicO group peptidase (beta-lactamase class C family)
MVLMIILSSALWMALASAPTPATTCHFVQNQDYVGMDGAVVRGPATMQECCEACRSYKLHMNCTAAVWVPARKECVAKCGDAMPVSNRPGVVSCVVIGAEPPGNPPSPPPDRWPAPPPVPPAAPPPPPRVRDYWPTAGWRNSTPEAQGMDPAALQKAVEFVQDFGPGLPHVDAFIVIRGGYIVTESYFGGNMTKDTIHDIASGTKSIGSIALAHAVHAGRFTVDSKISQFFSDLKPLNPQAATQPLQVKHAISMAGGTNATYWQGRDGCGHANTSCPCVPKEKHCAPTYPFCMSSEFVIGLRHGPPGAPESIAAHGLLKKPGSDFTYSYANPALMTGVLRAATGQSYASYCAKHIFPILGIGRHEWYWLGDREGDSQPDGGESTGSE